MNLSPLILECLVFLLLYKSARTGKKICGCTTDVRDKKLNLKCSSLALEGINNSFIRCVHEYPWSSRPNAIDFSNSSLKRIPALGNISFQSISASNNFIIEIDESLLRHGIKNLIVSNNSLTRLNLSVATNLHSLAVSHNGIRELILPEKKCNLESIQIQFNKFSSLPDGLHICKNLLHLNAMNNSIHIISMDFFKLMHNPINKISRINIEIVLFHNPLRRELVLYELRRYAAWISDVRLYVKYMKCGCAVLKTEKTGTMAIEVCISSMCVRKTDEEWFELWTCPLNLQGDSNKRKTVVDLCQIEL